MSWFTPYSTHVERCFRNSTNAALFGLIGIGVAFVGAVVVGCVLIATGNGEVCQQYIT